MWKFKTMTVLVSLLMALSTSATWGSQPATGSGVSGPVVGIDDNSMVAELPTDTGTREEDPNFTKIILADSLEELWGLACGDLDGDNDVDIVFSEYDEAEIHWLENTGGLEFNLHLLHYASGDIYQVTLIDMDGDEDLDVVYGELQAGTFMLVNEGEMNFSFQTIGTGYFWKYVIVDLNQDGRLDVVGNNDTWNEYTFWSEQLEDHTFTQHTIDETSGDAYGIDAADMDGDGDIDIVQGAVNQYDHLY